MRHYDTRSDGIVKDNKVVVASNEEGTVRAKLFRTVRMDDTLFLPGRKQVKNDTRTARPWGQDGSRGVTLTGL